MVTRSSRLFVPILAVVGALALGVGFNRRPRTVDAALVAPRPKPQRAIEMLSEVPASQINWLSRAEALPRALEPDLLHPPLQPGDIAPDFTLRDQTGKRHHLANLRGKTVILSFYPQDLTQMCAVSAESLSQAQPQILARGAVVFGVSVQNIESKRRFAREFGLKIPLLTDDSKQVARSYRVLSPSGRAARVTFVIGPDGRVESSDQNVHAATHGQDLLAWLDSGRTLSSKGVSQH